MVSWTDHSWSGGDTSGAAVRGQIFDPRIAAVALTGTPANDEFHGTSFGDAMAGRFGNDRLFGAASDDRLYGGNGNDALRGNTGNDKIHGQAGNDLLFGGIGNDRLNGGSGKDIMTGGGNADVFVFTAAAQSAVGVNRDRIVDFAAGSDTLDVSGFMAGGAFIGSAAFTPGSGPQLRFSVGTGILRGDVDGNGTVDFQIRFDGAPVLTAADFLF